MSDDADGLIDPADPEYEMKVAEWYQRAVDSPREGDDIPVRITKRQAQKIGAIMSALARGHVGYGDAVEAASWFLDCAAAEADPNPHMQMSMTAAEAWERVDAYPWPRAGAPRDQPL